jgi:hypothetical protein
MDFGFFMMRKTSISHEISSLLKDVTAKPISGTLNFLSELLFFQPAKYVSKATSYLHYNVYGASKQEQKDHNDLIQITRGKLIKGGGGIFNTSYKLHGTHVPSYLSWNFFSALVNHIHCDIREKYVYLSYTSNFLESFRDNMFSDVALTTGKRTIKDTLTNFMMMPYRFYATNKFLGALFAGFCIVGSSITLVAMSTPGSVLASALVVETMAATGKILKIVCTPFINMPKAFARTGEDISKIDKFLKEKLEPEVLTKIKEMKESYITNFLAPKNIVKFIFQAEPSIAFSADTDEGIMAASKAEAQAEAGKRALNPEPFAMEPIYTDSSDESSNVELLLPPQNGGKKHTKKKRYYKSKRI